MPELMQPQIRVEPLIGLGPETGVCRRDPSDVIRVGDQFFVWYTKVSDAPGVFQYPSGYSGELWYAMSKDGHHWQEQGLCLRKGGERDWDGHGVFTPGILVADGHYYLFYTAVGNPMSIATPTAIGVAAADSPRGPWRKFARNPILRPSTDPAQFDSFRVDDACLLVRGGEYWLYYKGRQAGHSPKETKWGVAIAKSPMGPYTRSRENPVTNSGHEVLVWPHREGIAALIGAVGPEKNTIQFAEDGIHFRIVSHIDAPPMAPGGYRLDAFTGSPFARGMEWGIAMKNGPDPYLVRFDCHFLAAR